MNRIVIAILTLVLLTTAILALQLAARSRARSGAEDGLVARAEGAAAVLDHTLQVRMTETFTLAALPSLRGLAASDVIARASRVAIALSELQAIAASDPDIRAAYITDENGIIILATDDSINAPIGDRLFVQEALAGHLHASAPERDFGEISQYYSAPILNNSGDVAGTLVIRIAVQDMWDLFNTQSGIMAVDENGVRVMDRSAEPLPFVAVMPLAPETARKVMLEKQYGGEVTQIRVTNLPELADALRSNVATLFTFHDIRGQSLYGIMRPMQTNAWRVIAFEREDIVLAPAWDALSASIVAAIVALMLAVAAAYAATHFANVRELS